MWHATPPCILFVNLTRTVSELSLCRLLKDCIVIRELTLEVLVGPYLLSVNMMAKCMHVMQTSIYSIL